MLYMLEHINTGWCLTEPDSVEKDYYYYYYYYIIERGLQWEKSCFGSKLSTSGYDYSDYSVLRCEISSQGDIVCVESGRNYITRHLFKATIVRTGMKVQLFSQSCYFYF